MSYQDTRNVTFSPGSVAGPSLSPSPVGQQLDLFGQEAAHASPFRWPELERALKMKGISGRSSHVSSTSAGLQQSLESRLRLNLDVNGSPEYVLTWKRWDMESGPPICALRASARPISGRGCSGWPTPNAMEGGQTSRSGKRKGEMLIGGLVAGWPTPQAHDVSGRSENQKQIHGTKHGCSCLVNAAKMAGWPTPCGQDGPHGGPNQGTDRLPGAAGIAGWSTPCAQDAKHAQFTEYEKQKIATTTFNLQLYQQADLAGWATPAARDWKSESATDDFNAKRSGHPRGKPLSYQVTLSGQIPFSSPAETGKRGVLAPDLPRWLMGYPEEHLAAGMKAISKR